MGLLDFNTKTVGVDPGSQNLRIIHNDQLIFNEKTELSIHHVSGKVTGVGNEATHDITNQLVMPVNTVITDFNSFELLLRGSLNRALKQPKLFPSSFKMFISIPISATNIDQRAYRDSAECSGAKEVYMIYQPCCSAIGMGILHEKKDFVIVDFGASKVEITVFSNSLPITYDIIRMGTWKLQQAIKNYIFRNYNLSLTQQEIETLLLDLPKLGEECKIQHKVIKTQELHEVLNPYLVIFADEILDVFVKKRDHERINQIISNGLYFTGGGATITWLIEKIDLKGKIKFKISTNPLLDNINGLKKVIQAPEKFKKYLMT
jgi:rod shape-determining protein MreB